MRANRYCILLCCWIAAALAGGCTSSASISSWQRNVESYVAQKGDPNALRDVAVSGDRRGFAVIGEAEPAKSTDATAVLLGHKVIDNQPWFIYLVGLVHQQKVGEMRLAAVTFVNNKAQWRLGSKDPKASGIYRHYNEGLWKQHPVAHEKTPAEYTTFPRSADAFELKIDGTHISATHPPSGAQWELDLASPKR